MADPLQHRGDSRSDPARRCFAITPSDTTPLPFVTKAIRAGGTGAIRFRAIGSDAEVTHPVIEGERIDVCISYVRATGTTVSVLGYA